MTRLKRYFNWVLIWMLTAAAINKPTFGESVDSKPILIFRVLNLAQVPADILLGAKKHVERIYDNAKIQTLWLEGDGTAPVVLGRNTLELTIVLVTESVARKLGDYNEMVTGFAPSNEGIGARRAYVFAERANKKAQDLRRNIPNLSEKTLDGLVLGYVIAHEAGHLMLPSGHSARGIMRARMDVNSFHEALNGNLLFTSNQNELIRTTLLTQSGR